MNEQNQTKNQANNQAGTKNNEQTVENQAFTVMNGKVVPLNQAKQAQEQMMNQNTQTGVQQHHDNSSEAVQAGQVAQNKSEVEQTEVAHVNIRPANVQSGQQSFEGFGTSNKVMTEEQKMQQAEHDAVQKSVGGAKEEKATKTNKKG